MTTDPEPDRGQVPYRSQLPLVPAGETPELEHSHTEAAIAQRLAQPVAKSYLRDAVYGAIDGAVTTFAVVSGVSGAGLSPSIIIILGVANLLGDGFSMAAANFLGTRAENQLHDKMRAMERNHIEHYPDGEKEEVRQILKRRGYEGELLEQTLEHITSDKDTWVDTMLQYEHGITGTHSSPLPAAVTTMVSFIVVGLIPLLPFITQWLSGLSMPSFTLSTLFTAVAFFFVGSLKARYVEQSWIWSALETLLVGCLAAAIAYSCGYLLSGIV